MRTLRSLIRSRYGPWVMLGETVILAIVLVALWWSWRGMPFAVSDIALALLVAVPLALAIICLLAVVASVALGVAGEAIDTLKGRKGRS